MSTPRSILARLSPAGKYALLAALPQLAYLLTFGPRYEPDVHYYLTGALHWHPQHPPGYNFWLSCWHKLYPSVYLPVVLQQLVWAAVAGWTSWKLFGPNHYALFLALALGTEPTLAYLHLSLQSDSLFASSLLLSAGLLMPATGRHSTLWGAGIALALAGGIRYAAVFCWPAWLAMACWQQRSWRKNWLPLTLPLLGGQLLILGGQWIQGNSAYSGREKLLWDNVAPFYQPGDCGDGPLCTQLDAAATAGDFTQWPPMARYVASEEILLHHTGSLIRQGIPPLQARQAGLTLLGKTAAGVYAAQPLAIHAGLVADNAAMLLSGHFLEYRFLPQLHFAHMSREYAELDSLIFQLYGYTFPSAQLSLWEDPHLLNRYMQVLWLVLLATGIAALCYRQKRVLQWLLLGILPLLLMMGLFPLKTRFVIVFLPLWLCGAGILARHLGTRQDRGIKE
ncbi:MAG: glycosyltransferase family 39 protein [Bacteroidetes bacterium]|nr:glycosyltransferase family 39 protein [Bacteroidota bacterium]